MSCFVLFCLVSFFFACFATYSFYFILGNRELTHFTVYPTCCRGGWRRRCCWGGGDWRCDRALVAVCGECWSGLIRWKIKLPMRFKPAYLGIPVRLGCLKKSRLCFCSTYLLFRLLLTCCCVWHNRHPVTHLAPWADAVSVQYVLARLFLIRDVSNTHETKTCNPHSL